MKKKAFMIGLAIALSLCFLLPSSARADRRWETAAIIAGTAIVTSAILSQTCNCYYSPGYCYYPPPPSRVVYVPVYRTFHRPRWRHRPYYRHHRPYRRPIRPCYYDRRRW